MFENGKELSEWIAKEGGTIAQAVLQREYELFGTSREDVYKELAHYLQVMRDATAKAVHQPQKTMGGMIVGDAERLEIYRSTRSPLIGPLMAKAVAGALSCSEVNASMGKICAGPTAGACGILPAALLAVAEEQNLSEQKLLDGLLAASAVGVMVEANATISGAVGGCQAECGTGAAMAAGAVVFLLGGSLGQMLDSAAIALQNVMGLVCDPVAGLVETPCSYRNASGVANALVSADMALAGIHSPVPFDEVVKAMGRVGRMLPYQLRETAQGGIADTPSALAVAQKVFGKAGQERGAADGFRSGA